MASGVGEENEGEAAWGREGGTRIESGLRIEE